MPRICMFTWRGTATGHNVSHSNRKTKRTFKVNLINKKILPGIDGNLKISTRIYKKLRGFI